MTEAEWLAATDPVAMLEIVQDGTSDRKLRLLACAACRRVWDAMGDERSQDAVVAAERFADGSLPAAVFDEVRNAVVEAYHEHSRPSNEVANAVMLAACIVTLDSLMPSKDVAPSYLLDVLDVLRCTAVAAQRPGEPAAQADLFREIFGNPFRPVTPDPAWLTSTVTALSRQMYVDRAFDRMPILADALQDAGCDNDDVLSHCRGAGPHVRGCWVLDWVLREEQTPRTRRPPADGP
ncbi:flagellar hook-basal body complex protein FliE [Fimbriiglobus ruber]|uniref:Uncharacterized protein n=1 Tax=Fimbriiglobus ruber TaxID=1908690 RepID=A0A225DNQ6_9BACT|nr:flagellar hook-basal body complex protein FliE [Fimbriiglobus ruber]OWK37985.1 hypothetical protein FRUB_07105 [Fimbriiglobus ruber]